MANNIQQKLDEFFSQFRQRKYGKGQVIIHAGDQPQHIYYIKSGKIRQYGISYRGEEKVVNVFKPGAFFPLLPSVTGLNNRYFFRAEADTTVLLALPEKTTEFLKDNPDVMYDLIRRLYIGMDGVLGRTFYLMAGSARDRIIYELIIECRRFGKPKPDGSIYVPIHVSELAAHAGLTRETASREIQKLARKDLLSVKRPGLIIKDFGALEAALGAEL